MDNEEAILRTPLDMTMRQSNGYIHIGPFSYKTGDDNALRSAVMALREVAPVVWPDSQRLASEFIRHLEETE